jgi:hypothetical protein
MGRKVKPKSKHIMQALKVTIAKHAQEIVNIQKKGGYPHDYSLGFTNALIFIEHRMSGRGGAPLFFDRKSAINELPRPVVFDHEYDSIAEAKTYETLIENIIFRARAVSEAKPESTGQSDNIRDLAEAIENYDKFLEAKELQNAKEANDANQAVEESSTEGQTGSGGDEAEEVSSAPYNGEAEESRI